MVDGHPVVRAECFTSRDTTNSSESCVSADTDSSFGGLLRGFRHGAGLTLEALSERSGVTGRAISNMERGHSRSPQRRTLVLLADALELSEPERAALVEAAAGRANGRRVGARVVRAATCRSRTSPVAPKSWPGLPRWTRHATR